MSRLKLSQDSGIYLITCTANGRIYIGSSVNLYRRWALHCSDLRLKKHHNRHLQRAWNKYGEDAFTITVLEKCTPDQLLEREQHYLNTWKPYRKRGFNLGVDAKSPQMGRSLTPEHRAKIAAANKGRVVSPEGRARMSQSRKGRKSTPEQIAKRIESQQRNNLTKPPRYRLISPDGEVMTTRVLYQFCIDHGIGKNCLYNVLIGKQEHHRGWRVWRINPNDEQSAAE